MASVEAVARVLLRQYESEYNADHLSWQDFADSAREVLAAIEPDPDPAEVEAALARIVTSSIAGTRWRDLTPLDVARHLVANGVRIHP